MKKMKEAMTRHQERDAWRRLTIKSEPVPVTVRLIVLVCVYRLVELTTEETPYETADRKNGDMHGLAFCYEFGGCITVEVFPKCCCIVSNIAVPLH